MAITGWRHYADPGVAPLCRSWNGSIWAIINKQRLRCVAPGLTPRAALEKFAGMQMVDVHLPTTDHWFTFFVQA